MDWNAALNPDLLGLDIGEVNLRCAHGLPGTEEIDFDQCLALLDRWAECIHSITEQSWPKFERDPKQYWDSRAKYRILALMTVLQRDIGVRYDPSSMDDPLDCTDAVPWFICGPITGRGGTCVSLPFLFVAVGRRLGYPLFVVRAMEHLFLRWEERDGEQFDIECTSNGFRTLPDDYYLTWPKPLSKADLATRLYLRNLSPSEEVLECLMQRGHCLLDHLRIDEALTTYRRGCSLRPGDPISNDACRIGNAIATYLEFEDAGADFDQCVPGSANTPVFAVARRELARIRGLHAREQLETTIDAMINESFIVTAE